MADGLADSQIFPGQNFRDVACVHMLSYNQGDKKEGRRNDQSALGRCVMRSRTGSSGRHCSKVQNMAASESRWLVEKSDCYAKTVRRFREILLEMK